MNLKEIKQKNKELKIKEKSIKKYEDEVCRNKQKLKMQIEQGLYLKLPEDKKIPITNEFIAEVPEYVESFAAFINDIRNHTEEFIKELKATKDDTREQKVKLEAYFLGVCTYTITHLFQWNGSNRVRVHFRTLTDEEEYIKLVATTGIEASNKDLTPIPISKANMITRSYEIRSSLIKSLNMEYHYETANENTWEEYLTYTFDNLIYKQHPFLSFGISVKNKRHFTNLFYFLNFCKIEYVLQENLDKIANQCDIINVLTSKGD